MSPFLLAVAAFMGIITVGAGIASILFSAGTISVFSAAQFFTTLTGKSILYVFGGLLIAVGLHYAALFYRGRMQMVRFSQEGTWGRIELSPYALRELVSGIMKDEIGIDRFQVQLGHMDEGLSIRITTTLSPEDKVAEIGERIQETLARLVAERTGVDVREVSVLVNSIHPQDSGESPAVEGENEHTDDAA